MRLSRVVACSLSVARASRAGVVVLGTVGAGAGVLGGASTSDDCTSEDGAGAGAVFGATVVVVRPRSGPLPVPAAPLAPATTGTTWNASTDAIAAAITDAMTTGRRRPR